MFVGSLAEMREPELPFDETSPVTAPESDMLRDGPSCAEGKSPRTFGSLLFISMVYVGMVMVLGFTFLVYRAEKVDSCQTTDLAIRKLAQGQWDQSIELAGRLYHCKPVTDDGAGVPAFILGTAIFEKAKAASDKGIKEPTKQFDLAIGYLIEANEAGVPRRLKAPLFSSLGRAIYHGRSKGESRRWLEQAILITSDPALVGRLRYFLVNAILAQPEADINEALKQNKLLLQSKQLTAKQRDDGNVQKGKILLQLGRAEESSQLLKQVILKSKDQDGFSVETELIHIQSLLMKIGSATKEGPKSKSELIAEQATNEKQLAELIGSLKSISKKVPSESRAARQAAYMLGIAFEESKDLPLALKQYNQVIKDYPDSSEARAAVFREASFYLDNRQFDEAMSLFSKLARSIVDPGRFSNPWFSVGQLRGRLLDLYDQFEDSGDYPKALALVDSVGPILQQDRSLELRSDICEAIGKNIIQKSSTIEGGARQEELAKKGRRYMREVGDMLKELSQSHEIKDSDCSEFIWRSAEAYLGGHDFVNAKDQFEQYLKLNVSEHQPQSLLGLGRALASLGLWSESTQALDECIDFYPNHAATLEARLCAGKIDFEMAKYARACQRFEANLHADGITPRSEVWKETLFQLGFLLVRSGRYNDGIEKLDEAIRRYPDASEAVMAEYLLGEAYRAKAAELVKSRSNEKNRDTAKRLYLKAFEAYGGVERRLSQAKDQLSISQERLLRNSFLFAADTLFQSGQFEESIKAYSRIVERYPDSSTGLSACLQMARAYDRLDRPQQSRLVYKRAKQILAKIPTEVRLVQTTNYNRQQWQQLLDSLERAQM
jgi:tetratricopeptide (TPR) repeat protein